MKPAKRASTPSKKYPPGSFMGRLKERKIIATLAVFIGGGWLTYEVVHWILVDHYHLPKILKDITIVTFLGVLLSTVIWRWFRGAEKKPGNVKIEVLVVPLIILLTLVIDLKFIFVMTDISINMLIIGIVALCLGIAWIVFKSLQWAAYVPELEKKVEVLKPTEEKPIGFSEWKNSIAVLPFTNISADPEQEYFCEGLSEELINALIQIKDLRVVARTSAFLFKGKELDIREIGRKLDVETVLEGSVRKSGQRLRITAQLINVADSSHLWSESFDREMEDIFAIQDEISFAIADKLKSQVLGETQKLTPTQLTENIQAYNLYLKGRYFQNLSDEGLSKSISYFSEAIESDNKFSLAFSALAESYIRICLFPGINPPKDYLPKAKDAAQRAVELDPLSAEAHTSLALVATWYDWDRDEAKKSFFKAIELNPNVANTRYWYANYLMLLEQKFEEALEQLKIAEMLDPLDTTTTLYIHLAYICLGDLDRALEQSNKIAALDSKHPYVPHLIGHVYSLKKMYVEAVAEFEKALQLGDRSMDNLTELGVQHAFAGNKEKSKEYLDELRKRVDHATGVAGFIAIVYLSLGEVDTAFEWIEKAYDEHDPTLLWLISMPFAWSVRFYQDPRSGLLLEKMGLSHLVHIPVESRH